VGREKRSKGVRGLNPYTTLKKGMRSSGMYNPIVGKLSMGKEFLPLSNVLHYHTS